MPPWVADVARMTKEFEWKAQKAEYDDIRERQKVQEQLAKAGGIPVVD